MTSPNNEPNAKISTIDAASSVGAFVELLVEFMEQVTLHRKYLETETVEFDVGTEIYKLCDIGKPLE